MLYTAENERDGGKELSLDDLPAPAEEANLPAHLIARLEKGETAAETAGIRHHRDVAEVLDAGLRSVKSQAVVRLPLPLLPAHAVRTRQVTLRRSLLHLLLPLPLQSWKPLI